MAKPNRSELEVLTPNATICLRESLETRQNTIRDMSSSLPMRMRNTLQPISHRIDILEQQIESVAQTHVVRGRREPSNVSRSSNRWTTKSTSTAIASGCKNQRSAHRESTYTTEDIGVLRTGASLRASFAMACALRRQ